METKLIYYAFKKLNWIKTSQKVYERKISFADLNDSMTAFKITSERLFWEF